MDIQIIYTELMLNVSGFGGTAQNNDYCNTAFNLMEKLWPVAKSKNIKHKGLNIWVFEPQDAVFAGVELIDRGGSETGLEHKEVKLPKYASYKNIGPYNLIKQTGDAMRAELISQGIKTIFPYIEIYGHWDDDESKLETELIMAIA